MESIRGILLVFVFSSLFLFCLLQVVFPKKSLLEVRLKGLSADQEETQHQKESQDFLREWIRQFDKRMFRFHFIAKHQKKLDEAGMKVRAGEFFLFRMALLLVLLFISAALDNPIMLCILPFAGFAAPSFYVRRKREKRLEKGAAQLPDVLGSISTSLKSGFSFMQSLQIVSKEIAEPLGSEFQQTLREMALGLSAEEALTGLLERLPNKDLEIMVNALLIQRSTGGNLVQILETIQETISNRLQIRGELKTLTAQGKLSATIITLLPVFLFFILNLINPKYFSPMLHRPLGWAMLLFASVFVLLGWVIIRKIVTIEV
jgi:tight adherence protein B